MTPKSYAADIRRWRFWGYAECVLTSHDASHNPAKAIERLRAELARLMAEEATQPQEKAA